MVTDVVTESPRPSLPAAAATVTGENERLLSALLVGILVVGGLLRFAGLSFRLPAVHHPDEEAILHQALRFGTAVMHGQLGGKLNLHGLVLLGSCLAFFVTLRLTGRVSSLSAFESYFFAHGGQFLLLGRSLSALTGTATIWATYRLGREVFDRRLGLLAAGLVAISPVAVTEAHYLKLDTSVCFLIVVALGEVVRQLRAPTRSGWWRLGLTTGLACAAHVNGAVLLVLPLLVFWYQRRERGARLTAPGLGACYAIALGCFLVLTFRLFGLFGVAASGPAEKQHLEALVVILTSQASVVATIGRSLFAYGWLILPRLLGAALLLAALGGVVLMASGREPSGQKRRLAKPILIFGGLYFLILMPFAVRAERYALPLIPVEALAAAVALRFVAGRAAVVGPALLVLASLQPAYAAARTAYEFKFVPDTRDLARRWVESNIPGGTRIAIEAFHRLPTFTLQVDEDRQESQYKLDRTLALNVGTGKVRSYKLGLPVYPSPNYPVFDLTGDEIMFPDYENPYDLAALRRQGVRYVILSSEIESLFDPPSVRVKKAQVVADILETGTRIGEMRRKFVDELHRSSKVVTAFGPAHPWRLRGPILSVYSLD